MSSRALRQLQDSLQSGKRDVAANSPIVASRGRSSRSRKPSTRKLLAVADAGASQASPPSRPTKKSKSPTPKKKSTTKRVVTRRRRSKSAAKRTTHALDADDKTVTVDNVDTAHKTMTTLSPLMTAVLSLQYCLAPFFCYPHKLAFHYMWGSSYHVAYEHFRRDHKTATNLAMHLVCLVVQVTSNFAFVAALDALFPDVIPQPFLEGTQMKLTAITALSWAVYLACTSAAPISVRALALGR